MSVLLTSFEPSLTVIQFFFFLIKKIIINVRTAFRSGKIARSTTTAFRTLFNHNYAPTQSRHLYLARNLRALAQRTNSILMWTM